ncbi:MAG TPA: TraY domain-containing protein [Thermoanaerobaculia bacterium]|jgi:plasmid stability protein
MPDVLIRNLDDQTMQKLRHRAERNGRSLQAELQSILERAATIDVIEGRALAAKIRKELTGRKHSDSAELVADDRRR